MKKLLLFLSLLIFSVPARAQSLANFANIFVGTTVPSSCRTPSMFISSNTGVVYTCQSSVFVQIGVGSGGDITPAQLPDFTSSNSALTIITDIAEVLFDLTDASCTISGTVNNQAQIFCGNKTLQGDTVLDGDTYVTGNFSTDNPIEITLGDCTTAVSEAGVSLLCANEADGKLYFSADGSTPVEIGAGGGNTITVIGNGLTSGGGITWTGNLNFTLAAAEYLIAGNEYSSAQTNLTLTASDPTNPRIDIFVVQDDGTVDFITGTPAATPAKPSYDPTTQFEIGFAYIEAAASVPANFNNVDLYLENTEWTCAASANFDCASTSNPFAGTKDVKGTTAVSGNNFTLTKPAAGTENLASYSVLSFRVRTDVLWPNAKSVVITALNGTTQIGTGVTLDNGTFGFNHGTTGSYQIVAIPVTLFNTGNSLITTFKFSVAGGGSSLSAIYFDNIFLQGGANGAGESGTVRFADGVVPTGAINGINQTYILPQIPNPSTSLKCFGNGLRYKLTGDYTFNATTATITTVGTFQTGDTGLVCDYRY